MISYIHQITMLESSINEYSIDSFNNTQGGRTKQVQVNGLQRNQRSQPKPVAYPSIDIYSSPRFYHHKIRHNSIKLCAYTNKIIANNMSRLYTETVPDSQHLRQFKETDGLIYSFKQMAKDREQLGVKILICVCMYNQSKNAINLTLKGIYDNLKYLEEEEGISWQEVAVVLVQDGILKLVKDRKTRQYAKEENSMVEFYRRLDQYQGKPGCALQQRINTILDQIDNYSRQAMNDQVGNNRDFPPSIQKNVSLLYQNEWHPGITDFKQQYAGQTFERKLQLFSCFKHLNGTKLSSHLWFFQGFCRYLEPKFIVLLDVGTKPDPTGVVNLYRSMEYDDNCGGATGLMSVDSQFPSQQGGADEQPPSCITQTFFSIQKAQEYEYIISHFLDKNAQGALGFLHVLPGAWSAYRYQALIKSEQYQPTLLQNSYFKTILTRDFQYKDYKQANMYLAQDRILSLGIYCQIKSAYNLKYVPNAGAKTDPMKNHQDLMKQRRRWINSSMFAFLYVWKNYYYHATESQHNGWEKYVCLNLSMVLALLSFVTAYLTPSMYFYVLFTTIYQLDPSSQRFVLAAKLVSIAYIMVFLIAVGGGLMGSSWTKNAHWVSGLLSIFTFGMWALVVSNVILVYLALGSTGIDVKSFNQMSVLIMTAVNIGLYYFVILMHLFTHPREVWRLFKDQISYMSYQGAYSQTMVAHSFCNVDDVSWGTKGSTAQHGDSHAVNKVFFVSSWLFYNCLLAYIMIYIDIVIPENAQGPKGNQRFMLIVIGIYGTTQLLIKALLAIYHHFKWVFTSCCYRKNYQKINERKMRMTGFWQNQSKVYQQKTHQEEVRVSLKNIHLSLKQS